MALLYFLATAVAVLGAVRKWLSPFSWPAGAVILALASALPGPALLTGRVFAPIDAPYRFPPLDAERAALGDAPLSPTILSDVYTQMIPWRKAVRFALEHGEWPLWNPFTNCGDPLAASMQAQPYFPPNLLSLLLPIEDAIGFAAAWTALLAALSIFLFLRELDLGEPAALVGAAAWTYCGFLLFWLQWPMGASVALFPLVLLAARRLIRAPTAGRAGFLAGSLLLLLLTGHPESMAHVVPLGASWGLAELVAVRPGRRAAARALGLAVAAGIAALALAAFWLAPFLDALPQSTEHHLRSDVFIHHERGKPPEQSWNSLVSQAIPFAFGVPGLATTSTPGWPAFPATAYVGAVLLAPILLGIASRRRRLVLALGALAIFGLVAGIDLKPFMGWLAKLPLFSISINDRLVFVAAFAFAALAALGVDEALRAGPAAWRRLGLAQLAALALAGAGLATFWPRGIDRELPVDFLSERSAWYLAPLLFSAALVAVLAVSRRRPTLWAAALLVLVPVQRIGEMGHFHRSIARDRFFPRVAPLDALPFAGESGEPYRVSGTGSAMLPNSSALWELEDIRGYQALTLGRLVQSRHLLGAPGVYLVYQPDRIDYPFANFLNVRFALFAVGSPIPGRWREVARSSTTILAENPDALARARVPKFVVVASDTSALARVLQEATQFARSATIEPWDRAVEVPLARVRNGPGTVETVRDGTGFRLRTNLKRESWVTVAESAWKGWRATIEGRELPLAYANHAYLGILVPAGENEVRLSYWPRSFELGLLVSGATTALLVIAGAARALRRRANREGS